MAEEKKKVIYSAMQPSGVPSLGNYLGALKNWKDLQEVTTVCLVLLTCMLSQ